MTVAANPGITLMVILVGVFADYIATLDHKHKIIVTLHTQNYLSAICIPVNPTSS